MLISLAYIMNSRIWYCIVGLSSRFLINATFIAQSASTLAPRPGEGPQSEFHPQAEAWAEVETIKDNVAFAIAM